jgi:hypothetical protein
LTANGSFEAWRADVAPFALVVGKKLDVRPPGLALGGEIGGLRKGAGGSGDRETDDDECALHGVCDSTPVRPRDI